MVMESGRGEGRPIAAPTNQYVEHGIGGTLLGLQPCVDAVVISSPASRQWFVPATTTSGWVLFGVTIVGIFAASDGVTRVPPEDWLTPN